jgi:hypothetical protein
MATSKIYWYPDGGSYYGTLEVTSLGEDLSDLQERPLQPRESARSMDGRQGVTLTGVGFLEVRMVLERFATESVALALQTLNSYLLRGGIIGIAGDYSKAWAGYATTSPVRGDTTITTTGNVWYESTAALASGDIVCIESLGDEGKREWADVSSESGGVITLSAGLTYSFDESPVLVRHRDYYPAVYLPQDQTGRPILTQDRRLSWTLDATLHTDPAVAAILYSEIQGTISESPLNQSTSITTQVQQTLQQLLGGWKKTRRDTFPTPNRVTNPRSDERWGPW